MNVHSSYLLSQKIYKNRNKNVEIMKKRLDKNHKLNLARPKQTYRKENCPQHDCDILVRPTTHHTHVTATHNTAIVSHNS